MWAESVGPGVEEGKEGELSMAEVCMKNINPLHHHKLKVRSLCHKTVDIMKVQGVYIHTNTGI